MNNIQRAIDKQAKLEAEATPHNWLAVDGGIVFFREGCSAGLRIISDSRLVSGHCDIRLIAHLRNQAALARNVLAVAIRFVPDATTIQWERREMDLQAALSAWAEHVNGEI